MWLLLREESLPEELTKSQKVDNFHIIHGTRNVISVIIFAQHLLSQMNPVQTLMLQLYQVSHRLPTLKFPNIISIFYYSWGHSRVSLLIQESEKHSVIHFHCEELRSLTTPNWRITFRRMFNTSYSTNLILSVSNDLGDGCSNPRSRSEDIM
jgi:hypothetical protein